ncbi:MAG: glycosyltransferase [Planctomycetes bacterium]|nr:glycosyltransferase [Planctomycetota bacterium]
MKIAIDLRRVSLSAVDEPLRWLRDALAALLARDAPHTYVLFHTAFNYHLFPAVGTNVTRHTLSAPRFYDELQDRLGYEGDFDLLLRARPDGTLDRFPLGKQIACVPTFPLEASNNAEESRSRLRAVRAYQTCAAALAVPNAAVRDALRADPWTTADVFVAPADDSTAAADALLAAFDRAAAPRIRVTTPPVVSIVTPSFNQGAFIGQTIDSVLRQDYPHIDYRVVDGGSTDDTAAVLKSYGDRVAWVSEKDRGQADAINKGMKQARGEIRAYLNSDDLLRPGAVGRVVEHFTRRPACDLVYGRDALIDAGGNFLGMFPTAEYSFETLADCCCISQPAAFWRKRLADTVGPFDASLHLVMDYDYWLRAGAAGMTFEHVPDVLAHTRMHRQSKTSGANPGAHRERFYRELFDVSLRHVGYVSSRYVHARLFASVFHARPWTRRYEDLIVRVVQTWYHNRYRRGKRPWRALVSVLNNERSYVLPFLKRQVAALNPRNWFRAAPPARVELGPDLWLGPELTLPHAGGPVRLAGVPARDLVLRVYHETSEVAAVELRADEPAEVCVEVPGGPLRITFSDADVLPDGRHVSFKLHGTTLFDERAAA